MKYKNKLTRGQSLICEIYDNLSMFVCGGGDITYLYEKVLSVGECINFFVFF